MMVGQDYDPLLPRLFRIYELSSSSRNYAGSSTSSRSPNAPIELAGLSCQASDLARSKEGCWRHLCSTARHCSQYRKVSAPNQDNVTVEDRAMMMPWEPSRACTNNILLAQRRQPKPSSRYSNWRLSKRSGDDLLIQTPLRLIIPTFAASQHAWASLGITQKAYQRDVRFDPEMIATPEGHQTRSPREVPECTR